jgi:hypothetical protein
VSRRHFGDLLFQKLQLRMARNCSHSVGVPHSSENIDSSSTNTTSRAQHSNIANLAQRNAPIIGSPSLSNVQLADHV